MAPNRFSCRRACRSARTARIKVEAIIPGFHSFFDITDTNFSIVPLSVTTIGDSGPGSLREAILDANSDPGLTRITFDVRVGFGVETIQLEHELPLITAPVIIDGWSQGGAGYSGPPLIELNGVNADPGFINNGLTISAGNSTVQGIIINRFSGSGIDIRTNGGNKIIGCYIGVNANGTLVRANALSGVLINNTPNNEIGRRHPRRREHHLGQRHRRPHHGRERHRQRGAQQLHRHESSRRRSRQHPRRRAHRRRAAESDRRHAQRRRRRSPFPRATSSPATARAAPHPMGSRSAARALLATPFEANFIGLNPGGHGRARQFRQWHP